MRSASQGGAVNSHTPGPWHIGMKPGPMIYGPKGEQVADISGELLDRAELVANAKLIAAAPTMFRYLTILAESGDNEAREIITSIVKS